MGRYMKENTFLKFIIVGIINGITGTAFMFALYNFTNLGYWISTAAGYAAGGTVSYFLNKYVTFRSKERGAGVILRYVANIAACYLAAYGIAKPVIALILQQAGEKVQGNVSILGGMCIYSGLNYLGQRRFAFKYRKDKNTDVC